MTPPRGRPKLESSIQRRLQARPDPAKVMRMSVASTLLRVVLMLSLLLNGLNAAMAGGHLQRAVAAEPPCHAHAGMVAEDSGRQAQPPEDDGHCRIKECVRSCAQQPALAMAGQLTMPAAYAGHFVPAPNDLGRPTPALPRIQRPPIA